MNNKYSDIETVIRKTITDYYGNGMGTNLDKSIPFVQYGIDSLDLLCIIVELERTFEITVDEEDFFRVHVISISSLLQYITKKLMEIA